MSEAVLWLEVAGASRALNRLRNRLSDTVWGSRSIAVPLDRHSAEEVLALCCSLEVQVRRSRVVREGSDPAAPTAGMPGASNPGGCAARQPR